jgi:hypothetical protein
MRVVWHHLFKGGKEKRKFSKEKNVMKKKKLKSFKKRK